MNALPASPSPEFISPLASKLVQFLAQKRAMGYRYREESRVARVGSFSEHSPIARRPCYHVGHCA
jgi:hypothetical protein